MDTRDALAEMRARAEGLAFATDNAAITSLILEQADEIDQLTQALTVKAAADSFTRFHRFDGIKDDMCPACGGRVTVDSSDPTRVRITAAQHVRAS